MEPTERGPRARSALSRLHLAARSLRAAGGPTASGQPRPRCSRDGGTARAAGDRRRGAGRVGEFDLVGVVHADDLVPVRHRGIPSSGPRLPLGARHPPTPSTCAVVIAPVLTRWTEVSPSTWRRASGLSSSPNRGPAAGPRPGRAGASVRDAAWWALSSMIRSPWLGLDADPVARLRGSGRSGDHPPVGDRWTRRCGAGRRRGLAVSRSSPPGTPAESAARAAAPYWKDVETTSSHGVHQRGPPPARWSRRLPPGAPSRSWS